MNFYIASTGRTATKWLSHTLNKSIKWTVWHEPRGFKNDHYSFIGYAFNNAFYGEVGGTLIYDFHRIEVKKAIIQRDYKELILSFANRYEKVDFISRICKLRQQLEYLKPLNATIIDYKRMTTDIVYLQKLFLWCGIKDYIPTSEDQKTRINENKVIKYNNYNELPNYIIELVNSLGFFNLTANF